MSPPIGKLRHRLVIEQPIRSADGGGGASVVWDEVAEVWGAIEAVAGKEHMAADRMTGRVSHLITIRHRSDIQPAMRFRRASEIFEISSILDKDGHERFLHCQCEQRDL